MSSIEDGYCTDYAYRKEQREAGLAAPLGSVAVVGNPITGTEPVKCALCGQTICTRPTPPNDRTQQPRDC
jgi:hypothetical protein